MLNQKQQGIGSRGIIMKTFIRESALALIVVVPVLTLSGLVIFSRSQLEASICPVLGAMFAVRVAAVFVRPRIRGGFSRVSLFR